jgi:hypothetical protein
MVDHQADAMQAPNIGTVGEIALAQEDLVLVSRWVKTDLFERVKFLYNPEKDLQVNGILYNLFVNDCKGRMVGLKSPLATGEYRKMYVQFLWQEANKKKRNIVTNGLTSRRSSVYAAMQNRFVGKSGAASVLQRLPELQH